MRLKNKKRVLSLILSILMFVSLLPTSVLAEASVSLAKTPEGTPISTEEELKNMDTSPSAMYYLTNDIELTEDWVPLGEFSGILDGNGHKITGLNITEGVSDKYDEYYYGLFSNIRDYGTVKNLGIEGNIYIDPEKLGENAVGVTAGLLAGKISNSYYDEGEARIENCWVKGTIISDSDLEQQYLGGLTGLYNEGTANNCYSAVEGAPIIGDHTGVSKVSNFYYDSDLYSGQSSIEGVQSQTTEFMKSQEFVDLLNANKGENPEWVMSEGEYPRQKLEEVPVLNTIEIYDVDGLKAINEDLSANYKLMNDIDLSSEEWVIIGSDSTPFSGTLDGNGFAIKNFIYSGAEPNVGMISKLTGTVKNLGIENAELTVTSVRTNNVGTIVGLNEGTIENCYAKNVKVTPHSLTSRSGLIAGQNITGTIKNSYASGTGVGVKGAMAVGVGVYENCYYDSDSLQVQDIYVKDTVIGKSTSEMFEEDFVNTLNEGTLDDIKWVTVPGDYPEQVKIEEPEKPSIPTPEEPEIDEESVQESIKLASETINNIVNNNKETVDPWYIVSMVANGNKDDLTKVDEFINESYEAINKGKDIYEIERHIIGLSALGVDATKLSNGTNTINAIDILGSKNLPLINAKIFALVAYDSGNYEIPKTASYTREDLINEIIDSQSEKGGWSLSGRGEDVDMTSMALHGLAPYYTASTAEEVNISEETYNKVKESVDKGIYLLSGLQLEDGSYSTNDKESNSNANSTAMVMNTLSALGIDALRDGRFIKGGNTIFDGLYKFVTEDKSGFGYRNNKYNDMATEQSLRALVSYIKFNETKMPYNIYKCNSYIEESIPGQGQAPEPNTKPDSIPEKTPVPDKVGEQSLPQTGGAPSAMPLIALGVLALGTLGLLKNKRAK